MAKRTLDIGTLDLISLDECVIRLQQLWNLPTPPYSRKTLQNRMSQNKYKRYGPYHHPLLDWYEVKEKELRERAG